MKFSKVLLGGAILAASVGFMACANDDDPNGMIQGSNNNYSVDYTNEDTVISRGISKTFFKHLGGAVEIKFNEVSTTKEAGVMGLIFDYDEGTNGKNFDVIGLRTSSTAGELEYYVSRFENITDLQGNNFGASTSATGNDPKETEYIQTWSKCTGNYSNGTTSIHVYVRQEIAAAAGKDTKNVSYETGDIIYKVYLLTDEIVDISDSTGDAYVMNNGTKELLNISGATPAAVIKTPYTELTQKKLSVYANVYPTASNSTVSTSGPGTLKGTWTYKGDYKQVSFEE